MTSSADCEQTGQLAGQAQPVRFTLPGLSGEISSALDREAFLAALPRLIDPASASETIHWGRNYLYATAIALPAGPAEGPVPIEIVIKQFRNQGWRRRLERRLRGSKASRSWRVAWALVGAGITTPEPLALVESAAADGPSFYLCRRLHGAAEVRHFFRRLNNDPEAGWFPEVTADELLPAIGRLARQLHDAGICYRDLSIGNILVARAANGGLELSVVDFNRARLGRRLGVLGRSRDLCRLPILTTAHRRLFLTGYWGAPPSRLSPRWWWYTANLRSYLLKHAIKNRLRGAGHRQRLDPGGLHHAHIPAARSDATARDRIVWDRLSDQPHQHTRGLGKLAIRLADAGSHLRDYAIVLAALPRVWRRYRQLQAGLHQRPVSLDGFGLALRPAADHLDQQIAAIQELGVRQVLIRLHPWEQEHEAEEEMARRLYGNGCELAFALPQNRDLVRDPQRWQAAIEELAGRFSPYGRYFQVGQAVNRSKWGIWTRDEYLDLYRSAAAILRRHDRIQHDGIRVMDDGIRVMGPAVIDFEHQVTMALVNRRLPDLRFDLVSSLLYVDRRGAPENRQLGFDTIDKVLLLRAIAETGRCCSERCWITEVNWPLWEGPHSPAGRKVAVDEQAQADYLVRYYLLTLATGLVERVYWWQLIARGYGLMTFEGDGSLRRRPSYTAFKTLIKELDGATSVGPVKSVGPVESAAASPDTYLYRFQRRQDAVVVGWALRPGQQVELPARPLSVIDRDGDELAVPPGATVELSPAPRYFRMAGS